MGISSSSNSSSSLKSVGESIDTTKAVSAFAADYYSQERDPLYRTFWHFVAVEPESAAAAQAGVKPPAAAQFVGAEIVFSDNDFSYFDRLPRREAKQPIVCFDVHKDPTVAGLPVAIDGSDTRKQLSVPYTLNAKGADRTTGTITFDANKQYPVLSPELQMPVALQTDANTTATKGNSTSAASLVRAAMATGDGKSSAVTLSYVLTRAAGANTLVLTNAAARLKWVWTTNYDKAAK